MEHYCKHLMRLACPIFCTIVLTGCSYFAATNKPISNSNSNVLIQPKPTIKAQFKVEQDRGKEQTSLVILALSGGGSRAAVLSSNVMLELENVFSQDKLNILNEVDVISSVSGGSLPAAYYAISHDKKNTTSLLDSKRYWDRDTVSTLMRKNYILRWFGNWFWPTNIVKYWFTAYDRSDIMAQTFADNLFDEKSIDLTFADINPNRPNLIINATNGTSNGTSNKFSKPFTFTDDDFDDYIKSDINKYDISRAVMASASFPAVFNFMTLYDHRDDHKGEFLHVFDGGNADNLGLTSTQEVITKNDAYERIIVILVDAYIPSQGVNPKEPDARSVFSFLIDMNFIDSSNSLLEQNHANILKIFKDELNNRDKGKTLFYHFRIADIGPDNLREQVSSIPTNFKIKDEDADAIEEAVKGLIVKDNICLKKIRDILIDGSIDIQSNTYCTWKSGKAQVASMDNIIKR